MSINSVTFLATAEERRDFVQEICDCKWSTVLLSAKELVYLPRCEVSLVIFGRGLQTRIPPNGNPATRRRLPEHFLTCLDSIWGVFGGNIISTIPLAHGAHGLKSGCWWRRCCKDCKDSIRDDCCKISTSKTDGDLHRTLSQLDAGLINVYKAIHSTECAIDIISSHTFTVQRLPRLTS